MKYARMCIKMVDGNYPVHYQIYFGKGKKMKDLITNLMEEIRVQYLAYDVVLGSDEVYDIAVKRLTERTQYVQ